MINIFDKIEKFSNKIAWRFTEIFCKRKSTIIQNKETKKIKIIYQETVKQFEKKFQLELELYEYFFYLIISSIFELGVAIILSLIFNYFWSFIIVLLVFLATRGKSAGLHERNFRNCAITTNVIFLIFGLLAKLSQQFYIPMAIVAIFSVIFIMPIVPIPSENAKSRGYEEDTRFRKEYSYRILFFYLVEILLIYLIIIHGCVIPIWKFNIDLKLLSTGISSGLLIISLISSKIGHKIIHGFWDFYENKFD